MKAVFIGCVDSSERALISLLTCEGIEIEGVVTRRASPFNTDFCDLTPICESHGIPVFFADQSDKLQMQAWIASREPEVGFCIGWSFLLDQDILNIPNRGIIGYHPAVLPRNRGRHPIIWALALGLKETGSTLFITDRGTDSGDIVSQVRVQIDDDDNATSLYARLINVLEQQLREIAKALASGHLQAYPQDHDKATYWRKRGMADGQIDWRMPADGIRNLVRALRPPYPGAHCVHAGKNIKIHHVETIPAPDDIEPGFVIGIDDNVISVKAGIDAVRLIDHEFTQLPKKAEYLS